MDEVFLQQLLARLSQGNPFGEKVVLVAATKTRTPEEIGRAIALGVRDVGENRVREFIEKYDQVQGARRHFIGRLQTNKVKYLIGKTDLIHSVDRDGLAREIALRSRRAGIVSDVLLEINIGGEASKGGYPPEEGLDAFRRLSAEEGLRVKGFMAMLPRAAGPEAEAFLGGLCDRMRALFDAAKRESGEIEYLSMGMSGDFELCIRHGSNMIRLGTAIFGARPA